MRASIALARRKLRRLARRAVYSLRDARHGTNTASFQKAMASIPLLIAEKTYNGSHPDYDRSLVRSFPGRIFNADVPCNNPLFAAIRRYAFYSRIPSLVWLPVLRNAMKEATTVPGFPEVMERKRYTEHYLHELGRATGAHYAAGWVTMADAWFLYWAVRRLKPKVVIQTGVSNGLSCAFIMLALAKNGADGQLYAIDLPHVIDPGDPAWRRSGTVYGVAIPEGKESGWIVPGRYRDRFHLQIGDAKELLPALVDRVDGIDLFFHDSDHSYNHMMFEFEQVIRKLTPRGTILADDVSWNASLWDFADQHSVPAYNYRGTIGAAFF